MDFNLPDEIQQIKQQMRRFVDEQIVPYERDMLDGSDLKPDVRRRLEAQMKEMGYWHISTPEEYGGLGLGLLTRCILWEVMGRTIAIPTRKPQIFGPDVSPILFQLNAEQKEEYLHPVIRGEKRYCFGLTEPDAGSDPSRIRTTATRDGDYYIVNGYKRFISNALKADFIQLMASTDRSKGARGLTTFLVDMSSPGVKIIRTQPTMMDDDPCEIAFDDVRVPARNRVGEEGEGFKFAQDWINVGRLRHGARAIGVIERCLEMSVDYAKQRVTFGKPLSDRQSIQWMLVDCYMDLQQLRTLVYQTAWRADRQEDVRNEAMMVKILGDRMSFQAADRAIQIHGGIGLTPELPLEKFWRDQRSMMITEGSEEVLRMALARNVIREFGR
ncbi:MAG: acyl-CoA dehydrogenase [Hyphomicrobiales bacterium]|nr:acyl-CoA dehydrogenase [Hyphomicrobiales bacterium]